MSDVLTPEQRSRNMAAIKSKNTKPEILIRRLIHSMGFRYRLHRKDLAGKPDLVFPALGKVIFVHGCYWHMHNCRFGRVVPKTNAKFWKNKRESNKIRDKKDKQRLRKAGWHILTIWECQLRNPAALIDRITAFLQAPN